MTALGGIGHTLPFLFPDFRAAMTAAMVVVVIELAIVSWIRHKYMDSPPLFSAAVQVGLGGLLRLRRRTILLRPVWQQSQLVL